MKPALGSDVDLTGRVAVVTGANSGIGTEVAVKLARVGATVVAAGRRPAAVADAVVDIECRGRAPGRVVAGELDLASLPSVRAFADRVMADHGRLDVLVNNAGTIHAEGSWTAARLETTFATNHLGHFELTRRLLGALADGPEVRRAGGVGGRVVGRVVTVSSIAHRLRPGGFTEADLRPSPAYDGVAAYARAKLANIWFTRELARRGARRGVVASCCHPGLVRSGFGADGDFPAFAALTRTFGRVILSSTERGARTPTWLAADPRAASLGGRYVVGRRARRPSRAARDDAAARWLWSLSERLVDEADAVTPAAPP